MFMVVSRKILLSFFFISNILLLSGCVTTSSYPEKEYIYAEEITINQSEYDELSVYIDTIKDETLKKNFIIACKEINLDITKIKNLKQIPDWINGERYSFSFEGSSFTLYANADMTIASINTSNIKIYKQGFESYNVDDYLVDIGIVTTLQIETEEKVKNYLTYPLSANFNFLGWGVSREKDLYTLSSTVKTKNAFGVKAEIHFVAEYKVIENSYTLISLSLGNKTVFSSSYKKQQLPERKEKYYISSSKIKIIEGVAGQYGKIAKYDGHEYIWYKVPEGKYKVTNNGNWAIVWVNSDRTKKNSSGYTEEKTILTLNLNSQNKTGIIEIKKNQHISLTNSSSITLERYPQ